MATGTARWRELIAKAAKETEVPANLIEAMMRLESNGNPNAKSPHGAVGLMQVVPKFWKHLGDLDTPAGNILVGAKILLHYKGEFGSGGARDWDRAICAYFTGKPEPTGRFDGFHTDHEYIEIVLRNWGDIDRETQAQAPHVVVGPPASANLVSDKATLLRQPRNDADVLARLKADDVVELAGKSSDGFFQVTHDGQRGWIHRGFLVAKVAEDLTARSSPQLLDDGANVVGRLPAGTTIRFRDQARIGFVGIERDGGTRWVFGQFLTTPDGEIEEPEAGATATVTETAKVRRSPSLRTDTNVIGSVATGDSVTLTGEAAVGYVTIHWQGGEAWAYAEYLAAGADAPRDDTPRPDTDTDVDPPGAKVELTVNDPDLRLRSTPDREDSSNILVDGMGNRATVTFTGRGENGFLSVRFEDKEGWTVATFLRARVADTGLRLRSVPTTEDPTNILVDGMDFGAVVTPTGKFENGFLEIQYKDTVGWAAARFLGPLPKRVSGGLRAMFSDEPRREDKAFKDRTVKPSAPNRYKYGIRYGLNPDGKDHPGIDVFVNKDTTLFAPMAGKITCAGTGDGSGADGNGCGAFGDTMFGGVGRLELLLDNNVMLILGHTRTCLHRPGDRVEAGEALGLSGGQNSPHIHVEVRKRDRTLKSGWRIVDPREELGE